MFDPLHLLASLGGGAVLLLLATPLVRRREAERMRRTLEGALGAGSPSSSNRPPDVSRSPETALEAP